MKISNWCILFSVLFCGMILYTDLRFRYTMEAQYTMEEYNRIFDRAADDALTDQLQEEYWDGSLKIDEEKVQNRFFEQTAYVLDLTGETEKENLKELVLLRKLVNEKGKSLSVEEPDTERYPWTKMFDLDEIRYALSGAELVKKEED